MLLRNAVCFLLLLGHLFFMPSSVLANNRCSCFFLLGGTVATAVGATLWGISNSDLAKEYECADGSELECCHGQITNNTLVYSNCALIISV